MLIAGGVYWFWRRRQRAAKEQAYKGVNSVEKDGPVDEDAHEPPSQPTLAELQERPDVVLLDSTPAYELQECPDPVHLDSREKEKPVYELWAER